MKSALTAVLIVVLCLSPFLASAPRVNAQQSSSGSWPMFRADPSHSGLGTGHPALAPTLLWSYTGVKVYSSPAVVNGILYVGSFDGSIYALNATNGAKIWNYTMSGQVLSSPAVVDGIVYVGSSDGNLYALDADTGGKLWNFTTARSSFFSGFAGCGVSPSGNAVDSSPVVADGVVYVGSYDHNVYALNSATGAKLWNYTAGGTVWSSPAVADGVVYVGSFDNNVYALNAIDGDRLWNYDTGGVVESSPSVVGGVVYVGNDNGNVYALNAKSGTRLWNYTTTYTEAYANSILSSPAVVGGVVYIGSENYYVYALNATDGDQLWNCTTNGEVDTSPAVVGGVVYIGSYGPTKNILPEVGNFCALNATDGDQLWSFSTSYLTASSPAFFDGVVYVGGGNIVYALGTLSAPSPQSTSFNTPFIIVEGLAAVVIVAIAVLFASRKRLKTKLESQRLIICEGERS